MKKFTFLTLLAFIFFTHHSQAQITKGSLMLGGSVIYSSYDTKAELDNHIKQNMLTVSPVIGTVIKDNLIVGGGLGYTHSGYQTGTTQKYNAYGASIFIRKYRPLGKEFYFFIEGSLNGNYGKSDNRPIGAYNNFKRTSVGFGITPGIAYALSRKWQVETGFNQLLGISYAHEKGDKGGTTGDIPYTSNSVNIITGLSNTAFSSLYVGFKYFFGKG